MAKLNIAGCQMLVSADIKANLKKITEGISRAADSGADLVAFPECAVSGYPPIHHASIADIDMAAVSEANSIVCDAAAKNGIWVTAGTIVESPGELLNTALLIDDKGNIVGKQDKLHMYQGDRSFFVAGNSLGHFEVKGVRIGLQVCYDVRFPEAYRVLRETGVEAFIVILNACGGEIWKRPVMEGTFRCRAAENTAYLAAVNCAGPDQMCVSRICDPFGIDLASAAADTEQIITAQIDTERTHQGYYHDRRADLFSVNHSFPNK